MHNNIMAAGSRDRSPMLATGRYAQWQSRFLRYIDTRPNGDALRKCILEVETLLTMSPENKAHYESEKEAIHLLLTGIRDEIYSTIDAFKIAHEICYDASQCSVSLTTSTRMVKEVNKIWEERIANNANPLALVAAALSYPDPYYQAPKSHKPYAPTSKQSSSTRSNASTKLKGKEIAKPITPPSESASKEDSDLEQAQRDKDMQKNLAFIAKYFKKTYKPTNNNLRTSLNSRNKNVDTSPRYKNDNQTGQFRNQRTVIVVGAWETVVEQADWLEDTDEDIDEQELEAHYNFMEKIQEVPTVDSGTDTKPLEQVQYDPGYNVFANERQHSEQPKSISNTCVVEKVNSNVIPDSPDMCDNDIQTDQNVVECDDECVVIANLIANLKLDVDENKKIQKELVDQAWEKHSHDHFHAPTSHDMEILIKTCLMPLAIKTQNDSFTFVHKLKQEMHADLKYVESIENEINELESNKVEFLNMYDILLQECVSNDVMCSYLHSLSDLDAHNEL
ncbi:hypothetical protein Tco_0144548 [Tanacetum coccineum]